MTLEHDYSILQNAPSEWIVISGKWPGKKLIKIWMAIGAINYVDSVVSQRPYKLQGRTRRFVTLNRIQTDQSEGERYTGVKNFYCNKNLQ